MLLADTLQRNSRGNRNFVALHSPLKALLTFELLHINIHNHGRRKAKQKTKFKFKNGIKFYVKDQEKIKI